LVGSSNKHYEINNLAFCINNDRHFPDLFLIILLTSLSCEVIRCVAIDTISRKGVGSIEEVQYKPL